MAPEPLCDLFRRCLARRDAPEWQVLVRRFGGIVRNYVYEYLQRRRIFCHPQDVDELVQELWCRLLRLDNSEFRGDTLRALKVYLRRVARSVVIDHDRTLTRAKRYYSDPRNPKPPDWAFSPRPAGSPEERAIRRDSLHVFYRRCRRLTRGRRAALRMRILRLAWVDGLTSREVSRALRGQVTAGQVDSLLFRLRRRLATEGIEVPSRAAMRAGRRRRSGREPAAAVSGPGRGDPGPSAVPPTPSSRPLGSSRPGTARFRFDARGLDR